MHADEFRRIALSMPEASESAHMGHPDFRIGGKIFATLGYPDVQNGVVILPPEEQERFVWEYPLVFTPVKGAWGRQGATQVRLATVDSVTLRDAIISSWRKKAPPRLRGLG
jgi:hypothetical protein